MSKWISVEAKPEIDGYLMVFRLSDGENPVSEGVSVWFYRESEGFDFLSDEYGTITHWQPLPKPPKE